MFRDFGRDLRFAVRALTAAPGFSLGVIGSLVLGIVANITAFSFLNAAVFRPFPGVRHQHELVAVHVARAERFGTATSSSYEEYLTLRASLPALDDLAAQLRVQLVVTRKGESSAVNGALVSAGWFDVLGVRPAAGRFFLTDESHSPVPVAVIGHDLWRRLFSEDPAAVGQMVMVNGLSVQIVGVAPARFYGIHKGSYTMDVWLPFGLSHLALRDSSRRPVAMAAAGYLPLTYVGRRRPQTAIAQVEVQAATATQRINASRPADKQGTVVSTSRVWLNDPARMAPAIVGFMAVPLLVLIIACVNAANLLLARSSRQRHEWQMRMALGASRWRIVRQVLTESLLLALLAAAAGLLLTSWALGFIAHTVPVQLVIDTRVQTFTIAAVFVTAMAFGFGPALHVATRASADPRGPSQLARGTSRSRVRFILIAAQSALSLGLLATGAQFVNTVRTDFGRPDAPGAEHLLIASFDVEPLNMERAATDDFYARLLDRSASLPGVVAAGFASAGPVAGAFGPDSSIRFWFEQDAPAEGRDSVAALVSGDYFKATGTPLLQGRGFAEADRDGLIRPAIVSQSFAKRFLDSRAVGRSLRVAVGRGPYESAVELIVVGVAGPAAGERGDGVPMLYYSAPLAHVPARSLHLRFDQSGQFTLPALQKAVRDVDYRVPIRDAATLRERRDGTQQERRLLANGVAALGIFALTLAAGGLYGVVSYLVALRRRELGIRLALGASPSSVVGLVVRQGLMPAAIGAVIGAGGAIAIGLAVRSRLYGASAVDPSAFAAAVSLLLATMAIASLVPARYAASVDPAAILREE